MAGPADLRGGAEQRPRLAHVAVTLAQMRPVGADPPGKRDRVVDDEGDLGIGADALQRLGEARERVFVHVFDAKLEGGGGPRLQRRLQSIGKDPSDLLRADQIEAARPAPFGRESLREVPRDFVQRQAVAFSVEAS